MDLQTSTDKFDWVGEDPHLPEECLEALLENFPTLEHIYDASIRDLTKTLPGVGPSYATGLKQFVNNLFKEGKKASKDEDNGSAPLLVGRELLDHEPTPEELEEREEEERDSGKEYVLVEIQVDKFYRQRKRIEVGPATCRECGFDVINVNDLPPFEELTAADKSRVRQTLNQHMKNYHSTPSGKRVISEKEMGETSWETPITLKP